MITCNICDRRILSHSTKLICFACRSHVHLQCLSCVTISDSIYTQRYTNNWLCTRCAENELPFNGIHDDNEFHQAISESWLSCNQFSFEQIASMQFNPFETNDDQEIFPWHDIDPDLQYYNEMTHLENVSNCNYYVEDSFNKKCINDKTIDDRNFSLIQMNIRSIPKNLSDFEYYLNGLNLHFTIIGVSETWLNEANKDCYAIKGYHHISQCRANRTGGGVSVFVKDSISFKYRGEFSRNEPFIESLFIELPKSDTGFDKDTLIGMIYRPPNQDVKEFTNCLMNILQSSKHEKKLLYLMGDFNINLLEIEKHVASSEFLESLYSFSLFPLITKPTRITTNSSTLIDNIYFNNISSAHTFNGILFTGISDHLPVFTVSLNLKIPRVAQYRKARVYSSKNISTFNNAIKLINWSDVMNNSNGPEAFSMFYNMYCEVYNRAFPLQIIKPNYYNKKPWLTKGTKKSIKTKNKLYVKQLRNPSTSNIQNYKSYKRELNKTLKLSERCHYEHLLCENKQNSKKLWSILKDVINKKKSHSVPKQFNINNLSETDPHVISNKFNLYFTNIGNDLAKQIPTTVHDPLSYIPVALQESIFLSDVNSEEVETIIRSLKNASAGHDGIHTKVLKESYMSYLKPLTHVLNLSISQGFFPNCMKLARVVPLYKSGDPMNITNYRPVSILPLFSKIIERLMYNRLISFINKHKILYQYQFGFRNNHSANMALVILIDRIAEAIEKGELVVGVFLDFQKAFDTVNHSILLSKLHRYGIRGTAQLWFRDYLSQRQQYVLFSNAESEKSTVKCGVPQGSILGPLLFLLYINDLVHTSNSLMPILFADDTNIFLSGNSIQQITSTMNAELKKIVAWLHTNKLSLNVKKTHYMIFRSKRRKVHTDNNLYINGSKIDKVENTKFLGVTIDSQLSWQKHVSIVKGKIARGLGVICKARKSLSTNSLMTLYYSLIYPHFTYCVEVWGNSSNAHINSLIRL